jgi:hypothetical protein
MCICNIPYWFCGTAKQKKFKKLKSILFLVVKYLRFGNALKGQSHEKIGEIKVWGVSLGPN